MEPRCRCSHSAALHAYGRRGGAVVRTACSASGCHCARYEPGEYDHYCPTCGVRISPLEAARIPKEDK